MKRGFARFTIGGEACRILLPFAFVSQRIGPCALIRKLTCDDALIKLQHSSFLKLSRQVSCCVFIQCNHLQATGFFIQSMHGENFWQRIRGLLELQQIFRIFLVVNRKPGRLIYGHPVCILIQNFKAGHALILTREKAMMPAL